ncbi:TIGR03032 family protein [Brevibacillus halotolerans]|uniref:TIGR03032 family protein n=1 Tax=Brevibacillus TaxID=55080 RepID=UPI00215BDCC8|nr:MULTISPECIES: TIGR03032 family protein [Brevibacillus]MCR8964018.1 TIGR03032 family protein [Brevibacillus laterosporus]MCZ0836173.1 TIGR03032 family protein [Brevibacillus halotolerans]
MLSLSEALLISAPNGGGLACYENRVMHVFDNFSSTGLALHNSSVIRSFHLADSALLMFYHPDGAQKKLINHDLADIHDLLVRDDVLYAVSTGTNEIVSLCTDTGNITQRWSFPGEGDSWHVNCIDFWNGRLVVSAFCEGMKHGDYYNDPLYNGFIMDVETKEKLWLELTHPHTPKAEGNRRYVCDSGLQRLLIQEDDQTHSLLHPGYPRGLCFTDDYILLGVSQPRNLTTEKNASIKIIDKKTFIQVDEIELPFTEVYDIKILPAQLVYSYRFDQMIL